MPIVITRPKYRTFPEALKRLWYRDRSDALILGVNLGLASIIALLLLVALPVAGVYFAATRGVLGIVFGVVITLAGPYLARRFVGVFRPRLDALAWLLVDTSVTRDADSVAPLTAYEREAVEAIREAVGRVRDAAEATAADGAWARMQPLRHEWLNDVRPKEGALSRTNNVAGRFEMIRTLLVDGSQQTIGSSTFAELLVAIGEETETALASLLLGQVVAQGGTTWPAYYEQGRRDDLLHHDGEPVSLRKLLDQRQPGE